MSSLAASAELVRACILAATHSFTAAESRWSKRRK